MPCETAKRAPDHPAPGLERPDNCTAHLLPLVGRERLASAPCVDHQSATVRARDQDEAAVGSEDIDEDVQAVVEHLVALEDAEEAVDQLAHVAPHRLRIERLPVRERFRHDPQGR
jgi:hypothetical protein